MHGSLRQPTPLGLVSAAIGAAIAMAVMDGVMMAVALPIMARDLGASDSSIILVVSAYQLAVVALILPLSALAARLGLKRVYIASITLLGAASLACALAPTLEFLIVARIVQGAGGAGIAALTNALLRRLYPPDQLVRALGINAAVAALSLSGGPSIAAFLLSLLSWHWLFFVNVPVAVFALVAGMRWLGHDAQETRPSSVLGMFLSMMATGATVVTLNLLAQGAAPLWIAISAIAAGIGWLVLTAQQRRGARPLLSTSLLKTPRMWPAVLIFFLAAFAQTTAYIAIPFKLHGAGYRPAQIGLIFTAWPIAVLAIGPISSRLCRRYPLGTLGGVGLLTMAVGLAGLALMSDAAPPLTVGLIALSGLGYGFYQIPNTQALVTVVPVAQTADATAMGALSRGIGQASGAAIVALALRLFDVQATSFSLGLASMLALLAMVVSGKREGKAKDAVCG
jgi:DHA2 family multidrug resistance protein-like MFS transporter